MKKVLKSIVIFVLTFAMVFSIVACADQSDPNDTPPSTATEKMLKVKKPFLTSTTFPMSVDPENVYFGWESEATIRGAMQRSYRIIVADNVKDIDNNRGNVWDSGWILSDRQTGIPCGTDLSPETVYYYKVNLRDQNGKAAGYSPAAVFETGVDAMHGYYIGGSGAKILRKVFSMEKDLKDIQRARLSVTSGSYLEPHMNGQKIGNLYDAPGRTVSDIETLINTYNILPYLKNGDNAVGFLIGDLYGYGPSVKAEINIYYNDGTVQRIVTDESWFECTNSYITMTSMLTGENKNYSLYRGWDTVEFVQPAEFVPCISAKIYTEDGLLYIDGATTLYTKDSFYGDYTVEVKFELRKKDKFGILFGDNTNGANTGGLWQVTEGEFRPHPLDNWMAVIPQPTSALKTDTPLTMKINVKKEGNSSTIATTIDGFTHVMETTSETDGPIGIRMASGESAQIDSICVTQNGTTVFRDDFSELDNTLWDYAVDVNNVHATTATIVDFDVEPTDIYKIGNSYIVDFGKNMAGYAQITANGYPGAQITVEYAEMIQDQVYENGNFDIFPNTLAHSPKNVYTLSGQADTLRPSFFYTSFRYIRITGYPGELTKENVKACFTRENIELTSFFKSSDKRLNDIYDLYVQGQMSNMNNVYTDCPGREKQGWTGDVTVTSEAVNLLFRDAPIFNDVFTRYMQQNTFESGRPMYVVPRRNSNCIEGVTEWSLVDPVWTSAQFVTPYESYLTTGDTSHIEIIYETLKKIFAFYQEQSSPDNPYIITRNQWADWLGYDNENKKIDGTYLSTVYVYYSGQILYKMAEILGDGEYQTKIKPYLDHMYDAIQTAYFKNEGYYSSISTQTSNAVALDVGIVPKEKQADVLNALLTAIEQDKSSAGYQIMTGVVGTKSLYDALSQYNKHDILYQMTVSKAKPSFGYMLDTDATTLREHWDKATETFMKDLADEIGVPGYYDSQNHCMFGGGLATWLYKGLAGINSSSAGYSEVTIRPGFESGLSNVSASVSTYRGTVSVDWTYENGKLDLKISLPANTKAIILLPMQYVSALSESGTVIIREIVR